MKRKKVLIDVNSVVDIFARGHFTGIGRTTMELVKALDQVKDDYPFEVHLFSQNLKGLGCKNLGTGFKSHHLWLRNSGFMKALSQKFHLRELMTGYDLLHIPHNYEKVSHPDKTVVTLHDALFMHIAEKKFDHVGMRTYVPELMRMCRHVITCSEYSKQDIISTMRIAGNKITVIPWGIKHEVFNINSKKSSLDYPYFLSVSCNAERKRTDTIVRSYLSAWTPKTRNHLVLVWRKPPENLLHEIAIHPGSSMIHFKSNVSDEELAELYRGAKAFVFASEFEGFGLPLIEAMACGCPVTSACNSSLREVGNGAAIFLEEPIEDRLRDWFVDYENDEPDFEKLIEVGVRKAQEYSWEKAARKTMETYWELLEG